ncbi:MAG TPA: RAMP superfamily CRISPR-associated protein [Anaerolineae bacterium]|jgi:CRISPR/Cas system CSM-associated protein Csm3 (group 7 of RAMP superfamily)
MHKRLVNELRLDFLIAPQGPLLIKSGQEAGADPTLLDMNFVRTDHATLGQTVYLPGSSLKGAVRSYCEKIGRTVGLDVCNPLKQYSNDDGTRIGCGFRLDKAQREQKRRLPGIELYPQLCPICQIFGHTLKASHLWLTDAYPTPETIDKLNQTEQRDGVAIDRISGAVAVGPFQLEVVTQGAFRASLTLRNFQLWQVGLLAVALRDMGTGRVPLGFAKSRGLGQVELAYERLTVSYPGQFGLNGKTDFDQHLYGVTEFNVESGYQYFAEPPLTIPTWPVTTEWGRISIASENSAQIEALLKETVQPWANYVQAKTESHQ